MMKTLRIVAALLLLSSPVAAQGVGQLGTGQVWGNPGATRALAMPATMSAMLDRSISSTQGGVLTRNATAWIGLAPGTAGLPLLSAGAGANVAYNILGLAAGGTNANLTASNGGVFYSTASAGAILSGTATARQMLQSGASAAPAWSTTTWPATTTINRLLWSSAANVISDLATVNGGVLNAGTGGIPAMTITPVLGVPTSSTGTLGFAGATSGTATITPQAAAGTPTLTLPNASGTFAVSVSAPLALSATTGNMTVTGLAGGVLAGSTPAFTTTPVLGASGTLGTLGFGNATSGTITLSPVAGALGSVTLTMPAATDTIALLAAAQALSGKTYNGLTITTSTGTLTVPNGVTVTGPASSATLAGLGITNAFTGANSFSGVTTWTGSLVVPMRTVTAAGAITVSATTDYFICVNKTVGAATTVNLPASPTTGATYLIKDCKGDAATNNITLTPNAGNIDGSGTYVMNTNYQSAAVTYNASAWSLN